MKLRDIDVPEDLMFLLVLVLAVLFFFVDAVGSSRDTRHGVVIDKHYQAESSSVGTGYGVTNNGSTGIVVTSSHENEKFILVVETETGEIETIECKASMYYDTDRESTVEYVVNIGLITGIEWKKRLQ